MKKSAVLTAAFFCAVAFASCSKSDTTGNTPVTPGGPVQVTVKLVQPNTYAPSGEENGTVAESEVKQIELYVFNSDGSVDTKVGSAQNGYATFAPSSQTELKTTLIVSSGTGKKFVTVINANLGAVANYATLKNKLATGAFTANATAGYLSRDENRGGKGFEMTGEIVENIADDAVTPVYIAVNRLATKVYAPTFYASQATATGHTSVSIPDAQIAKLWAAEIEDGTVESVLGTGVDITNSIIKFAENGYAVINGLSRSDAFFTGNASGNDLAAWGDWSWNSKDGNNTPKNYLVSAFTATTDVTDPTYGQYTNNYSGPLGLDASFKPVAGEENSYFLDGSTAKNAHRVYVYENKADTKINSVGASGYNPLTICSFIIKGTLTIDGDTNGDLTKVRYWRVDLVKDDIYQVFRNTAYHINVKTITTIGKGTPKEAENNEDIVPGPNESAAEIEMTVNPWRLYEFETQM